MFTGIVQALQPITAVGELVGGRRLAVSLGPVGDALAQHVELGPWRFAIHRLPQQSRVVVVSVWAVYSSTIVTSYNNRLSVYRRMLGTALD